MTDRTAQAWGVVFARIVLGLMFGMAGIYKVFDMGALEHARQLFLPYQDTFLPAWALWSVGTVIPFVELAAGGLVLVGWKTRWAAIALGVVLVTVTFGHLLTAPLYAFHQHVMPRLLLVVLLLVVPKAWDRFSVDGWLSRRAD